MTQLDPQHLVADLTDDDLRSAGLTAGLDAIGVGAFLVRHDGRIVEGNILGWAMIAHEGRAVEARLAAELADAGDASGFELVRLAVRAETPCYYAVARGHGAPGRARLDLIELAWALSADELRVLDLLARGAPQRIIADRLLVPVSRIDELLATLLWKAQTEDRTELLAAFWSVPVRR